MGSVIAAGLLIGNLGIELSVRAASVVALSIALILVISTRGARFFMTGAATIVVAILFILGIDPRGEPVAKGYGFYSNPREYDQYNTTGMREVVDSHQLLYYRDGPTATVSVQRLDRYMLLMINGKTDASNGPSDIETQLLLGHLPLMVKEAKQVAIIGLGSGMTAGAVLSHNVDKVDVFEIEPAVVEASHFFDDQNGKPLIDPRLQLIVGDARSQLLKRKRLYDLIISEPSNPWISGVANLFTQDFFALAASRLKPGGILTQWFHLYGMSEDSVRTLIATFRSVFPHILLFKERDLILLGSNQPIRFNLQRMKRVFEIPQIKKSLSRTYIRYPFDLFVQLRLDEKGAEDFSKGARLNTDNNLILELAAPRSLYHDRINAIRTEMAKYSHTIVGHLTGYQSLDEVYIELAASYFTAAHKEEAIQMCRQALKLKDSFNGQKLLGQILQDMGQKKEAREAFQRALDLGGDPQDRKIVEALLRSLDSPADN